ncbi:hypothetical protein Nmel_017819, partial [Mimus melanotis]
GVLLAPAPPEEKPLEYRPGACASPGQTAGGAQVTGLYLGQMIGTQNTEFVPRTDWLVPLTPGLCPGHLDCSQDKWLMPRGFCA